MNCNDGKHSDLIIVHCFLLNLWLIWPFEKNQSSISCDIKEKHNPFYYVNKICSRLNSWSQSESFTCKDNEMYNYTETYANIYKKIL